MSEPVSLERVSTERKREPMSLAELEAAIRAVGAERYHDKHPFHHLLHGGKLNKGAGAGLGAQPLLLPVGGAAQGRRPRSAALHDRELRREWVHRLLDHDGYGERGRRHRALAGADRRRSASTATTSSR